MLFMFVTVCLSANEVKKVTHEIVSKQEFLSYSNVADFIDASPKVTVVVKPKTEELAEYGNNMMKSLTGSDCDRDGKMDDNATCNAIYYRLWVKYKR